MDEPSSCPLAAINSKQKIATRSQGDKEKNIASPILLL
jgi:hypothetical protein